MADLPGRAVFAAWRQLMLTVEADTARVEERLRSGGLVCPFCHGVLAGWGFARTRRLRGVDGLVRVRPRRAVCTGCGRTQVLLPVIALLRRVLAVEEHPLLGVAQVRSVAVREQLHGRH